MGAFGETLSDDHSSEHYTHQVWSVLDGLPVNHLNDIYQTPDGYLWLATFDGLVRFDGVQFTVYNASNTPEMPSNRLLTVQPGLGSSFWLNTEQNHLLRFEDGRVSTIGHGLDVHEARVVVEGDSVVWVFTRRGLFRAETGELVAVADPEVDIEAVSHVLRAADGSLWMAVRDGVRRLGAGEPRFFPIEGFEISGVQRLYEDASGAIWAFGDGIATLVGDGFDRLAPAVPSLQPPGGLEFFGVAELPDGLLASTSAGLLRISRRGVEAVHDDHTRSPPPLSIRQRGALSVCPDGTVWAGEGGRLYRNGSAVRETGLRIASIFCDREGSVWLATIGQGLHRYRGATLRTIGGADVSPLPTIYGIFEDDDGSMWLATSFSGIARYRDGRLLGLSIEEAGDEATAAFLATSDGDLWIGRHRCAARDRLGGDGCTRLELDPSIPRRVHALAETSDGALWVGTNEGVLRRSSGRQEHFNRADGLPHAFVRYILEARDGAVWVATNGGGIARFEADAGPRGAFQAITAADGMPSNNVRALYEDAAGIVWIATEDRGLARLDPTSGQIASIRMANGLYDDALHTVLEDDFGRLWMSTNRGLFWVPLSELDAFARGEIPHVHSTFYTEREGMRNREANGGFQNAAMKASDGRLWFATQDGAVVVDPRNLGGRFPPAIVTIEEVVTNRGRIVQPGTSVSLTANERNFTVRYTAPHLAAPERMRFRYRLVGFDRDWVVAEDRREAIYTNLPPGTYSLVVASTMGDDEWVEQELPLRITIAAHFYETWWFALLLGLAGLGGLGAGVHYRTRSLRRREARLRQLVEERTRELRAEKNRTEAQAEQLRSLVRAKSQLFTDISHEFRTPLTLTLGAIQDVLGLDNGRGAVGDAARKQLELAFRNGRRLQRLTNQLLDLARLEAGYFALDLQSGELGLYLRVLADPFVAAAERARIAFTLDLPPDPVPVRFDPHHFDKVLANLLSNAIKFTPRGGTVAVELRAERDQALVVVRDTGPGIPPEHLPYVFDRFFQGQKSELQPGTGVGLAVARQVAALHGASIEVESEVGRGSTFTVRLPLDSPSADPVPAAVGERNPEAWAAVEAPKDYEGSGLPVDAGAIGGFAGDDLTTVLIVDDNSDVRAYLRQHLSARYRVVEAVDGQQAIETIRSRLPDLVVSDVMMPRKDGFELLELIRSDGELAFLPVILLTARAEAQDRLAGLGLGADDYLTKPFEARELVARADNLIRQRRRLREHFAEARRGAPELDGGVPPSVDVVSADDAFLAIVRGLISQHLDDEDFRVESLAELVGQSRSTLYRRLQELTGMSPSEVLWRMRLERGAGLLSARAGTVSEVAYAVGFKSVSHFSASFRRLFGQTPSAYVEAQLSAEAAPN